jgi:hypothetical protein
MASSKDFIVETEQIKRAIELINAIEDDKFPLLLQRIALKIHSVQEASFKPDEIDRLEKSLNLSNESVLQVIEILEYIFLQAAFELIKPAALQSQLLKIRLGEEKSNTIVGLWQENAKDIIERIRQTKTISFRRLVNIKWRLNLQLASDVKTKQKLPNALFEFNLSDESNVQVEFSKEQLYEFFAKLEIIQKQIDALSG